jgi:hypothetical protein
MNTFHCLAEQVNGVVTLRECPVRMLYRLPTKISVTYRFLGQDSDLAPPEFKAIVVILNCESSSLVKDGKVSSQPIKKSFETYVCLFTVILCGDMRTSRCRVETWPRNVCCGHISLPVNIKHVT